MKSKLITLLSFFTFALFVFVACSDDEKDDEQQINEPYVGTWQSRIYPVQDPSNGDTLKWERMTFTFENTTVEDVIEQSSGKDSKTVMEAAAIRGIVDATETAMDIEVTKVSIGGASYIDKSVDTESFTNAYNLALGTLLDEAFTAQYEIYADGDSLNLTLPTKLGDKVIRTKKQ